MNLSFLLISVLGVCVLSAPVSDYHPKYVTFSYLDRNKILPTGKEQVLVTEPIVHKNAVKEAVVYHPEYLGNAGFEYYNQNKVISEPFYKDERTTEGGPGSHELVLTRVTPVKETAPVAEHKKFELDDKEYLRADKIFELIDEFPESEDYESFENLISTIFSKIDYMEEKELDKLMIKLEDYLSKEGDWDKIKEAAESKDIKATITAEPDKKKQVCLASKISNAIGNEENTHVEPATDVTTNVDSIPLVENEVDDEGNNQESDVVLSEGNKEDLEAEGNDLVGEDSLVTNDVQQELDEQEVVNEEDVVSADEISNQEEPLEVNDDANLVINAEEAQNEEQIDNVEPDVETNNQDVNEDDIWLQEEIQEQVVDPAASVVEATNQDDLEITNQEVSLDVGEDVVQEEVVDPAAADVEATNQEDLEITNQVVGEDAVEEEVADPAASVVEATNQDDLVTTNQVVSLDVGDDAVQQEVANAISLTVDATNQQEVPSIIVVSSIPAAAETPTVLQLNQEQVASVTSTVDDTIDNNVNTPGLVNAAETVRQAQAVVSVLPTNDEVKLNTINGEMVFMQLPNKNNNKKPYEVPEIETQIIKPNTNKSIPDEPLIVDAEKDLDNEDLSKELKKIPDKKQKMNVLYNYLAQKIGNAVKEVGGYIDDDLEIESHNSTDEVKKENPVVEYLEYKMLEPCDDENPKLSMHHSTTYVTNNIQQFSQQFPTNIRQDPSHSVTEQTPSYSTQPALHPATYSAPYVDHLSPASASHLPSLFSQDYSSSVLSHQNVNPYLTTEHLTTSVPPNQQIQSSSTPCAEDTLPISHPISYHPLMSSPRSVYPAHFLGVPTFGYPMMYQPYTNHERIPRINDYSAKIQTSPHMHNPITMVQEINKS